MNLGSLPFLDSPRRDQLMDAEPNVGLDDETGVSESGIRGWGPAYAVGRAGDEEKGSVRDRLRRWEAGVSTEAVLATDKNEKSDMDDNRAERIAVGTVVPQYERAHAEYTGRTDCLEGEDRTVARLGASVLKSGWCRYLRTKLTLVGLLEAPLGGPNVRRMRMVAHHSPKNEQELAKRWIRERPL